MFDWAGLERLFFLVMIAGALIVFGAGFGAGYGCHGCDYRLRSPIEKAAPPPIRMAPLWPTDAPTGGTP